ncbi:MAG: hypothetical protein MUP85_00765 [Candidatus Lokiarchaeota archaeon]|nr:hypothetical protein [Candidatus Lokiarchaeota archaeon]
MENLTKLEKLAQDGFDLAKKEKSIAKDSKLEAKQELKKAKIREDLVNNEFELAKIKERLNEKTKKYITKKMDIKDDLGYTEKGLAIELNHAKYNERESEIQKQIAAIHKKIAKVEKEIVEERLKLIEERLKVAKEREKLAKKQSNYVKLVKSSALEEKIEKEKEGYLSQNKDLNRAEIDVVERNKIIMKLQNELADRKKDLSLKLAEREKIRPEKQNVQI